MSSLRFFLILLLTLALDLSVPVPSPARDLVEESEDVISRQCGTRSLHRLVREVTAPAARRTIVIEGRRPARDMSAARSARPVVLAFVPKQPPPLAESSVSSDAH